MNLKQRNLTKIIGAIIGISLFTLLITGVTYAWLTWRSENINISGISECLDIDYTKGPSLVNESIILFDKSKILSNDGTNNLITVKNGMGITGLTAGIDESCTITGSLTIELVIDDISEAYTSEGQSTGALKYVLASYDPSTYATISSTALNGKTFIIEKTDSVTSEGTITLLDNIELSSTSKGYLVIFYVDGDVAQNDAQYSTLSATITAKVNQIAE